METRIVVEYCPNRPSQVYRLNCLIAVSPPSFQLLWRRGYASLRWDREVRTAGVANILSRLPLPRYVVLRPSLALRSSPHEVRTSPQLGVRVDELQLLANAARQEKLCWLPLVYAEAAGFLPVARFALFLCPESSQLDGCCQQVQRGLESGDGRVQLATKFSTGTG